jgi:hypothetical protein
MLAPPLCKAVCEIAISFAGVFGRIDALEHCCYASPLQPGEVLVRSQILNKTVERQEVRSTSTALGGSVQLTCRNIGRFASITLES